MTYQDRKREWIESWISNSSDEEQKSSLAGAEFAEKAIEDVLRNNLTQYAGLIQAISTIIDTKKDTKREELLKYLTENKEVIHSLKDNLRYLLNITRL